MFKKHNTLNAKYFYLLLFCKALVRVTSIISNYIISLCFKKRNLNINVWVIFMKLLIFLPSIPAFFFYEGGKNADRFSFKFVTQHK